MTKHVENESQAAFATTAPHSTDHDYAALNGAQGREIFFRPERFTLEQLQPLKLEIWLQPNGVALKCKLRDLSQGGLGLIIAPNSGLKVGDVVNSLRIVINATVLYDDKAVVASIRSGDEGVVLGLSASEHPINVEAISAMQKVCKWEQERESPLNSQRRVWRTDGHQAFRAELLDLRIYLDEAQQSLSALETSLPWQILHGPESSPALETVLKLVNRDFRSEFDRRVGSLFELMRFLPEKENLALAAASQRMVRHHFIEAPWLERAWRKPLGYAGDYLVMDHIYRREFEGRTLFAKAMSWASLHAPSSEAVHTRKELNKSCLRELFAARMHQQSPVRILMIASGSAQEVYELLQESEALPPRVKIILFDQDPGALSFAYARLHHLVQKRFPNQVEIIFLHDTIRRLILQETVLHTFEPMDAIISAGLYDYLKTDAAVRLTRSLFKLLAEGGFLNIGNMKANNPNRWVMEHLLDWWLIFREESQMIDFATQAAPEARVEILTEATGINPFVALHRD